MVRWKTPRRARRRRVAGEDNVFNVEESSRENEEESEDEDGEDGPSILFDGEHEDNYRDPLIRMAYFSLTIVSFLFHPAAFALAVWIELRVCNESGDYLERQKEKEAFGLLSPPMSAIIENNRSKFKQEINFLKECNTRLTSSTLINAGLEMMSLSYSLLVLLILNDVHITYPLFQLLFHFIIRCNYRNLYRLPHVTPRFHAPADIVLGITVDLALSFANWPKFEGFFRQFCVFRPCPYEFLLLPMIIAVLQLFGRAQHNYLYNSERLMRKHIREKYNQQIAFMNFH